MTKKLNLVQETKNVIKGIIFIIVLLSAMHYFELTLWQRIGVLIGINISFKLYTYFIKKGHVSIKNIVLDVLYIIIFIHLLVWIGAFGAIGYIISIIIIVAAILIRRKKKFLKVKHYIESRLFGKPLNEYIAAGEKVPKLNEILRK